MKINEIRKKIIINFSYSVGLIAILSFVLYYKINQANNGRKKIEQIKQETLEIKNNTEILTQRVSDLNRYKESWSTISDSKKNTGGIKIDEINNKLSKMASKHEIKNPKIQINLPEEMKEGIFDCKTVTVVSTSVQINFKALNDTRAILFISDLTSSLPGYVIIEKVGISKTRNYNDQDLVEISSGNDNGAIEGEVKFYWYAYKEKTKS